MHADRRRRLYLDANVFAIAAREPAGAAASVQTAVAKGEAVLIISDRLVTEVQRLFQKLYGRQAASLVRLAILDTPAHILLHEMEWQTWIAEVTPHVRDRADAPHVAAAFAGRADYFVTENRRSIHESVFDFLPICGPEPIAAALAGAAPWPSASTLRADWRRWAKTSSRSGLSPRGDG